MVFPIGNNSYVEAERLSRADVRSEKKVSVLRRLKIHSRRIRLEIQP